MAISRRSNIRLIDITGEVEADCAQRFPDYLFQAVVHGTPEPQPIPPGNVHSVAIGTPFADVRDSLLYVVYCQDHDSVRWYYSGPLGWRRPIDSAKRFNSQELIEFVEFLRESHGPESLISYHFMEVNS